LVTGQSLLRAAQEVIIIMEYKYAENHNYEHFSSGRVLYHAKGVPNFPVRLANELYGLMLPDLVP
jgi:hypothetical protein